MDPPAWQSTCLASVENLRHLQDGYLRRYPEEMGALFERVVTQAKGPCDLLQRQTRNGFQVDESSAPWPHNEARRGWAYEQAMALWGMTALSPILRREEARWLLLARGLVLLGNEFGRALWIPLIADEPCAVRWMVDHACLLEAECGTIDTATLLGDCLPLLDSIKPGFEATLHQLADSNQAPEACAARLMLSLTPGSSLVEAWYAVFADR